MKCRTLGLSVHGSRIERAREDGAFLSEKLIGKVSLKPPEIEDSVFFTRNLTTVSIIRLHSVR
jgi:hypothetical protein